MIRVPSTGVSERRPRRVATEAAAEKNAITRNFAVLIAATLAMLCSWNARAQSTAEEYGVKAAFLFHFAQLIEWPPDALASGDSLALCTFGTDPAYEAMDTIEGKKIGTRAIHVLHLDRLQDLHGCQLLFVSKRENSKSGPILQQLRNAPVVTVGDTEEFARAGGIIAFFLEGNKVRFGINRQAAEQARVKISSRLLMLAKP